jgi:hypothetical protein
MKPTSRSPNSYPTPVACTGLRHACNSNCVAACFTGFWESVFVLNISKYMYIVFQYFSLTLPIDEQRWNPSGIHLLRDVKGGNMPVHESAADTDEADSRASRWARQLLGALCCGLRRWQASGVGNSSVEV